MFIVDASLKCNFEDRPEGPCVYCYNTNKRRRVRKHETTNIKAIENSLKKEYPKKKGTIILHGGEPLHMNEKDLEKLLRISFGLSGKSAVQTNGSLITEKKIKLFRKYKTRLSVSIDGYWPANQWRGKTKKNTDMVIKNIFELKRAGVPTGALIALHKDNVVAKKIKYIEKLIFDLAKEGIPSKINPVYHPSPEIEITARQAKSAYLRLAKFVLDHNLSRVMPFQSIINGLLGRNNECSFKQCDPFCTLATHVTANGVMVLCRRFETKVYHQKSSPTHLRWEILSQTDCKNCRYGGKVCFGGCPAVARDWDWRNKNRFCEAYYALFEFFEKKLKTLLPSIPLKTEPGFRPFLPKTKRNINLSSKNNQAMPLL